MKKLSFLIIIAAILSIASCSKPSTPAANTSGHQSSWTFKGTTYTGDSAGILQSDLVAWVNGSGYNGGPVQQMMVQFPDGTSFPAPAGTYTVVPLNNIDQYSANHVGIEWESINAGQSLYYSSTGFGSGQTVTITVSGGKMSISGTGIELKNGAGADSAAVDFTIHQFP